MVIGDHALALEAARARIDAVRGARVVNQASWAWQPGPVPHVAVDLIVLEQTLDGVDSGRIASLAAAFDGTPMASVALQGDGQYRWVRFRKVGARFQVDDVGRGSLEMLLQLEAAATEPQARTASLVG